ncbi:MAG: STAS domain-containing protein [Cyanobacteriota bacterium]
MEIKIRQNGIYSIIDLPEDILGGSLGTSIKELVSILIEKNVDNILINCEKINKIDSLGLGALLSIQKICLFNGSTVKVFNLQPQVAELLYQTRMNRLIEICLNEEEATKEPEYDQSKKYIAINN